MFTKAEIIELSRLQRELDQLILSNIKKDSHAILNNKIIALIVELSEFINEHQGFKYWKQNKEMKRNLLLEELVDCLHFIISIAIDINFDLSHFQVNLIQNNYSINDLFLLLIGQVIYFSNDKSPANFFNIFQYYCFLLNKLNIKKREIMKHYLRKNKINHIRQTNSY